MTRESNYVGRAIARLRAERHWTQNKVANKLQRRGVKISRQIVANIECCRRVATDKQIYHLAKLFRVPVDSLFRGTRKRLN